VEFGDTNVRGKPTHTRFRLGDGNLRIRRSTRVPLESRRELTCRDLLPTILNQPTPFQGEALDQTPVFTTPLVAGRD